MKLEWFKTDYTPEDLRRDTRRAVAYDLDVCDYQSLLFTLFLPDNVKVQYWYAEHIDGTKYVEVNKLSQGVPPFEPEDVLQAICDADVIYKYRGNYLLPDVEPFEEWATRQVKQYRRCQEVIS